MKGSPNRPTWLKNTYFWWSTALFILGIAGLIKGPNIIRDPGQLPENNLPIIYLVAGLVMLVNGILSHKQTLEAYDELAGREEETK